LVQIGQWELPVYLTISDPKHTIMWVMTLKKEEEEIKHKKRKEMESAKDE
jgi:hypothetical protein